MHDTLRIPAPVSLALILTLGCNLPTAITAVSSREPESEVASEQPRPKPTTDDTPTPVAPTVVQPLDPGYRRRGDLISFVGTDQFGNATDLWMVEPDGKNLQRFPLDDARPEAYITSCWDPPKFSPDGAHIAFMRSEYETRVVETGGRAVEVKAPRGNYQLVVSRINTRQTKAVIDDVDGTFDWSPNGEMLIFGRIIKRDSITAQVIDPKGLWQIEIETGNQTEIIPAMSGQPLTGPDWSPDGSKIAFHQAPYLEGRGPFGVIDLASGAISIWERDVGGTDWSPGGQRIAFDEILYAALPGSSLLVANSDGMSPEILAQGGSIVPSDPLWSPNGELIAFGGGPEGYGSIFIAELDGRNPYQLTSPKMGNVYWKVWASDSQNLVVAGGQGIYIVSASDGSTSFLAKGACPHWTATSSASE